MTSRRTEPDPLPMLEVVSSADSSVGEEHDASLSGGTCLLSGDVHCVNAGTSGTSSGVAPPGRG